jgi:hypothetical protein
MAEIIAVKVSVDETPYAVRAARSDLRAIQASAY